MYRYCRCPAHTHYIARTMPKLVGGQIVQDDSPPRFQWRNASVNIAGVKLPLPVAVLIAIFAAAKFGVGGLGILLILAGVYSFVAHFTRVSTLCLFLQSRPLAHRHRFLTLHAEKILLFHRSASIFAFSAKASS